MVSPASQVAVLALLTTSTVLVHHLARFIVAEGFGIMTLLILFAMLKPLSRYLD